MVSRPDCRKSRRLTGFTLPELLITIGIIAGLIALLLPSLSKARQAANTIKCAANLHSIGQGMAVYIADFRGVLPPSNHWKGLQILPNDQLPSVPSSGTVHWSSFLYGNKDKGGNMYRTLNGWDMFRCPSIDSGGLPPANTFAGNSRLPNEATGTDPDTHLPIIDDQAPRLAYTVNEALCPRGFFVLGATVEGSQISRAYHFVHAGSVRNSSGTVLATELWGIQSLMEVDSLVSPGNGTFVSAARRPVSGFTSGLVGPEFMWQLPPADGPYGYLFSISRSLVTDLTPDPSKTSGQGSTPTTSLDWIGRNHGPYTLDRNGFDLRKTNFLYLDGHVETKNIRDTLAPTFQWGEQFYSLDGGSSIATN